MRWACRSLLIVTAAITDATAVAAPPVDGAAAYQARDYRRAIRLLQQQVKQEPKQALAWLDLGRAHAVLNRKRRVGGPCHWKTNWRTVALGYLSHAVELDRARVLAALDQPQGDFAFFQQTEDYRRWRVAVGELPSTTTALQAFLETHREWHASKGLPRTLTLASGGVVEETRGRERLVPGTWRVTEQVVTTTVAQQSRTFRLQAEKYHFDEGRRFVHRLILTPQRFDLPVAEVEPPFWVLGTLLADCE